MDKKEQALKRRKKRLFIKRVRSSAVLLLCLAIAFFAIKGLISLVGGKDTDKSSKSNPSEQISSVNQNSEGNQSSLTVNSASDVSVPDMGIKPPQNEFTTLVNTSHPLNSDFDVSTRKIAGTEKLFDVRAADSLEKMLSDARNAGCPMYLVSTYRTIAYQQGLYNKKVQSYISAGYSKEAAQTEAAKWVAIPGTSEHNLGLSADIVSSTWYNNNSDLTQEFEKTDHFKWLIANCKNYGFILRYPKDREAVTAIQYEPWHYRYVGVDIATYIMDNNLTLEEYWEN
ncbi:MAG: M15 family metallopeptidase [Oscillospiraceae bacterium]